MESNVEWWAKRNQEQVDLSGIDLGKLSPGTRVIVQTANNTYQITLLGCGIVKIKGGTHFPEEVERTFHGCTWGGSMLKMNWIGYDMHMEIADPPNGIITSSRVAAATVCGDGWQYEMEWPSRTDPR